MYWFKEDVDREILLDGRALTYVSNITKISLDYIYKIFNRRLGCKYQTALLITIICTGNRDVEKIFEERK